VAVNEAEKAVLRAIQNPYFTTGERLAIIKRMTSCGTYPGSPGFEDVMRTSRVDRRYTEDTRIEERIRNADQAVIRSTAIDAVLAEGVKSERSPAFVSLVDLSGVPMHEDAPDERALRAAVRRTLEHYPELRVRTSAYGPAPGGREIPNG
jgi:hypothetical protein